MPGSAAKIVITERQQAVLEQIGGVACLSWWVPCFGGSLAATVQRQSHHQSMCSEEQKKNKRGQVKYY